MNPSPLGLGAAVLLSTLLAPLGHAAVPDSQYWIYDGTSFAQVVWQNGSSTQDPQSYFSLVPPVSSLSAVTFADATANSMAAGVAAQSMAVGSRGSHAAQADARANNTLYGFTSGTYLVSFSYELGPQYTGSATASPEIGFELPGFHYKQSAPGTGQYSSTTYLDSWISFYAMSGSNSTDGTAQTMASITGISITAVPEPEAAWLYGAGLAVLAVLRRWRIV